MATSHHWRRRRSAAPLYLEIVDHDNQRFTIEGPVTNDNDWIVEVFRARQTGRRIACTLIDGERLDIHLAERSGLADYERWPSRSIVAPH